MGSLQSVSSKTVGTGDTTVHMICSVAPAQIIYTWISNVVDNQNNIMPKLTDLAPFPCKSGLAPTYPVNPTYGMVYAEMR